MSKNFRLTHGRRVGLLVATGLACAVAPSIASASAVNLATAKPFVVLGGSAVTNTGPSVLDGELGVSPGTSLTGFGSPAVVNGATHDDDAVAGQAQKDLTTAYNVAAGQAVPSGNKLTGRDLGGMTLVAGAYSYSSSAQLTGRLTLNAKGNANAQFVFEIGTTLTTASASSVRLINGASPCNVYWQIGSSATLGTGTAFQGNVLAHISITANTGATVQGRLLASTGAVTLDDNVINNSMCDTSTTPGGTTPGSGKGKGKGKGTAKLHSSPHGSGLSHSPRCSAGFTATVRGREIKRVVFSLDGNWLATRTASPFRVHVRAAYARAGHLKARVTFKDATRAKTLRLRYKACSAAVVRPRAPTFTG